MGHAKTKKKHHGKKSVTAVAAGVKLVAVIELGTTSIRMQVAQIAPGGGVTILDSLQQAVALGRDTFRQGYIAAETTETCVKVLSNFRQVLGEYQITDERAITAVASSAVREAANREAFLDRILIATGINVQTIDEAEVNRYTYLAVKPYFRREPDLRKTSTLVIEVGGGSTEALMFLRGRVSSAHMYPLGSLRLRRQLEDMRTPQARAGDIIAQHARQTAARLVAGLEPDLPSCIIAMGGDARLACSLISPDWDQRTLTRLKTKDLAKLTRRLEQHTVDELVNHYSLSYPDAESLVPALAVYRELCRTLKLKSICVAGATLRDGMLAEVASGGAWTPDFKRQILNSAMTVGKRFHMDEAQAKRVARHARELFELLVDAHQLDSRYEVILTVAAVLRNIGHLISRGSHHKHSMYIILNSDIFGLGARDLTLVALVARYHRRALPKTTHIHYGTLEREDRIIVAKLAAILRVADSLDTGRLRIGGPLKTAIEPGKLILLVDAAGDITLERQLLREKSNMFEQVYGMQVELRNTHGS